MSISTDNMRDSTDSVLLARVEAAIRALEAELGVVITIIDYGYILYWHGGAPLLGPARQSHRTQPVCELAYGRRCVAHCRYAMNAEGERAAAPYVHRCWNGVQEIVVPLTWQGRFLGNLFAGAWREPGSDEPAALPPLDAERVAAITPLLWLAARGIAAELAQVLDLEHGPQSRKSMIRSILHYGTTNPVQLADLAAILHLSVSRTGQVVRELTGRSFQQALTAQRMTHAAGLLRQTTEPLSRIASQVGMNDPFHFSRSFRRHVGISPDQYRRLPANALPALPTDG